MKISILFIIFYFGLFSLHSQTISTYAGNATQAYLGDGGLATSASLVMPVGVAIDKYNNLYIADYNSNVIRKVEYSTGIISTVAGTGTYGFSGDGGLATQAEFAYPYAIAVDTLCNLYIADAENHRIRKIDKITGIVNTIAGTGVIGYSGDGGVANLATLQFPYFLTLDRYNNIYLSQRPNVVRKIDAISNMITTVAGNGYWTGMNMVGGFSGDGGLATLAKLDRPFDIVVDTLMNLYIADYGNNRIRKVNLNNGIITTIAGTGNTIYSGDGGLAINANLYAPWGLEVNNNKLYIADSYHHRIRKVDLNNGIIDNIAGNCTSTCYPYNNFSGDGGPAILAELNIPTDVCVNQFGDIFIADSQNGRIRKVTPITTDTKLDNDLAENIMVYPNPISEILNITSFENSQNSSIEITNTLGQKIVITEFTNQIDLSNLKPGIYFLTIQNRSFQKQVKILKD